MKVGIISLGCAKNQVDTEVMQGILENSNYKMTDDYYDADIIIVNTCGFIDDAKEESVDHILEVAQLKETGKLKVLIVAGCLSQRYQESLKEEIPEIDAMIGTDTQDKITEVISSALKGNYISFYDRLNKIDEQLFLRQPYQPGPSAYIKIAEGCHNYCSYCAIPLIRGGYRSRTIEDIKIEANHFIEKGSKELTLIAQDTTNYGSDIYGKFSLDTLLDELATIPGDFWIRVLYAYPTRITDSLIEVINRHEKICSYLDIPLQHIDDDILTSMNRGGNKEQILNLIHNLRKNIPDITLRTSLIVGFPGETDEKYQNLISFMQEIEFDHAGIFKYSDEEDTQAYNFKDKVSEDVKEQRYQEAWEVQKEITRKKNEGLVGTEMRVLIEEALEDEPTTKVGRTEGHAPEVDGAVIIPDCEASSGDFINVEIVQALDYDLIGEMTNEFS
ncbi:30S ribosomal protein S12 methylthiotransferase RimO [Natranaerobius thermophilus]|uniref:Ribosomal protein uS12 methylthiotransferase RimO n=1 Tax=Natranaerobius thermophilus (strain ATCC BAA-1301 / DSM 18059 / JW/NM-WN-LF) TaxID=457570 RepID=RIMO_NATTJ|nr:30S ribosomal protein S12 methylthiotransferase RimO [Natranaerobius thermophilus]B2A3C0.1 RecName: Full=Ribosomal protein uS12 methylthiotransferase RimO; Short=uS12 MTTase; Short=uS12 methylthiotransferase; AltName: Full=Ribosomal protein uS12 (aspartate-C(3))-methylthiotransferase; AltName: Full=Ribosome maturation factor RimO [Natranaerobius thermophilus JW/NM-WN-LF]ACB85050.1 MiaB-like tRNA modifying enzyme YliG [Natranaerobius thermophilus JW/NM-WN-LF]